MKKIIAFILILAIAFGAWKTVQKSNNDSEEKPALCIVLECDNLFPSVDFSQLKDEIYAVVENYGYIRLVVADGKPYTAVDVDVPTPEKKYTALKQKKINNTVTDEIIEMMNHVLPKVAEDDLLGGIKRGKQELMRCRDASEKQMIVITSGISRAGALRFEDYVYTTSDSTANALLTAQPQEIVPKLTANYAIPDLSDIDSLKIYGIGSSTDDQTIPDSVQSKLVELWTAIAEEAGCPFDFYDMALTGNPPQTELKSTVIEFSEDTLKLDINKLEVQFDENSLGFISNEAVLLDIEQTRQILKPYAEKLSSAETEVWLIGLTATFGDPENCKSLSLERANVIKDILLSQGVPASKIHTLGLGQGGGSALRVDDTIDADIQTLELLRSQNRVVWLLGSESEKLKMLNIQSD